MTDATPIDSRCWKKIVIAMSILLIVVLPACAAAAQSDLLLTEMLDRPVYDRNGEEIGDVEDIVFRRTGQVQSVLISLNGFLGLQDKLIAVQYRKMNTADKEKFTVGYSRDQLERRSGFAYNQPQLYSGMTLRPAPAYGRHRRHARSSGSARSQSATEGGQTPVGDGMHQNRHGQALADTPDDSMHPSQNWHDSFWLREYRPLKLLGSALLGRAVFGRQGRNVADVDDLVIASKGDRARVVNIILGDGGFSGLSDARVTVPYRPISINYYGIQYPIGEAELEKMPAFDPQ